MKQHPSEKINENDCAQLKRTWEAPQIVEVKAEDTGTGGSSGFLENTNGLVSAGS